MRTKSKEKMAKIIEAVNDHARSHQGKTPSIYELSVEVGMSASNIYRYLKDMDRDGMIAYERGVIQTEYTRKFTSELVVAEKGSCIPMGPADQCCEVIDEVVLIPDVFVDYQKGDYFILKGYGNSMVDAGIDSGDLIIVRRQTEARNGQIVAALNEDGASTLKTYVEDGDGVYLRAENEAWDDEDRIFRFDPLIIQGVAVRVIKAL